MHCAVLLSVRNRTADEILCKGKITVVRPVTDHAISALVINVEICQEVFLCLIRQGRRNIKFAVFQQYCQPMKDAELRVIQIKNCQAITIDGVTICKAIDIFFDTPFFGHLQAVCAVKAKTVVIIWLTGTEYRFLNNV